MVQAGSWAAAITWVRAACAARGPRERSRFGRWFHDTFDGWLFRSMIGPAQTANPVQGCDQSAREQGKRELENRKRFTRDQRERRRLARESAAG